MNSQALRVVVAEDAVLLREGLIRLLEEFECEVVAAVDNGDALVEAVLRHRPDVAVVDVRMPPGFTDEGLRAAVETRRLLPGAPMLILATAQWAVSSGDKNKADAFRWLGALGRLDDIDSTLRNKARQLLADEGITAGAEASPSEAGPSLAQLEREVVAFLAHASHENEPD